MISLSGRGFKSLRLHSHPPKPLRGVGGFSFRLRDAALQAGPSLKMYTVHFLNARSPIRLHLRSTIPIAIGIGVGGHFSLIQIFY